MQRRLPLVVGIVLAVAGLVTGCTAATTAPPPPTTAPSAATPAQVASPSANPANAASASPASAPSASPAVANSPSPASAASSSPATAPSASPASAPSPSPAAAAPQPTAIPRSSNDKDLILATTTSTQDSGLLDVLIPLFQQQSGYTVKTVAVGTGAALALGARGESDVMLVHAPAYELVRAARAPILVAIAAGFGRAIAEVGASLMVGGNIVGQTRILTTAIALESGKGDFALALALGMVLLLLALTVNASLGLAARMRVAG
jgi:hypothetical protein